MKTKPLVFIASALLFGACDPEEAGIFKLNPATGTASSLSWLIGDEMNTGADPVRLRSLASNVGSAQYRMSTQNAPYLFQGDLRVGIEAGQLLSLQRFDEARATFVESGENWLRVAVPSAQLWRSFRVYDSGECSVPVNWRTGLPILGVPGFAKIVADEVDRVFTSCDEHPNLRFERVGNATITPIFRAALNGSYLTKDTDLIRFSARYRAISIAGCAPVNLDVQFEFGFRKEDSGAIVGYVERASSEVADFCLFESDIENSVNAKINERAPAAVTNAVRDRFLLDPRTFGVPETNIARCSSDAACANAYAGGGHRCKNTGSVRECWVQAEVDRINVRPEGVEFVLVENDEDPQYELITSNALVRSVICGTGRQGGVLPTSSSQRSLSAISVTPDITPADVCG